MISIKSNKIFYIFIIANILSSFRLFFIGFRAGLFLAFLMLILLPIIILKIKVNNNQLIFYLFLLFELITIANYFFVDISYSFFVNNKKILFQAFTYLIIPQIFFFFAGNYIGKSDKMINDNIWLLLKCNLILITIGIILHFIRPNFFLEFQRNEFRTVNYGLYYPRLTSYMNSLILGIVSPISAILSIEYAKKRKLFFIIVFIIGSFLTLQRGSIIDLFFGFTIYFMLKNHLNSKKIKFKIPRKTINHIIYLTIGILLFLLTIFLFYKESEIIKIFTLNLKYKLNNILNSILERNDTWIESIKIANEYLLGLGIGLLSHKGADAFFLYSVPDGNYFRILGELGYIGLILFILLITKGMYLAFRQKKLSIFAVLLCYSFHAIGTNVFDLYYASFIFWFLLGLTYTYVNK